MGAVGLLMRLALGSVLGFSAAAKLLSLSGSQQAAADLGVPKRIAPLVGVAVPAAELAIAATLLPTATARWAAAAALVLLLLFACVLALNIATGRRPECHCFGELSRARISWGTVLRNLLLACVAGLAWAVEPRGLPSAIRGLSGAQLAVGAILVVLVGAVALEAWALFHLVRQHGRILLRLNALESAGPVPSPSAAGHHHGEHGAGLPVGTVAPELSLVGLHGETMTLAALRSSGRPVLLVFSDPGCGPCTALAPDLARWQAQHADRLRTVIVASGPEEAIRASAAEHGVSDVLIQPGHEVAEAYRYQGTPGAVLIDVAGRIASPLASGGPAIVALVESTVGGTPAALGRHAPAPAQVVDVGIEAPDFRLPILGGGEASLSEFRGRDVVVLFWNPRCGFCQQLLPDLLAWEQERDPGAPELLVVSTGDSAANAAEAFASVVFLDATSSTMAAYGVSGTPIALAINAQGRVVSPPGIGAPGVKPLLEAPSQQGAET